MSYRFGKLEEMKRWGRNGKKSKKGGGMMDMDL